MITSTRTQAYFNTLNQHGVSQFHIDTANNNAQLSPMLEQAKSLMITPSVTAKEQFSALHIAAQYSSLSVFKLLVNSQLFDINQCDYKQRTPLHIASIAGRLDVALYLLEVCANHTLKDHAGFTAFHLENQTLDSCYTKLTTAELIDVCNVFDAQRKNRDGLPYPFITRSVPSVADKLDNFELAIKKYNLTGDSDILTQLHMNNIHLDKENSIPDYGHFIWVGSILKNPHYRNNILSFRENFPDLLIIVWVSHTNEELLNWCREHRIVALSTDLLINHHFYNVDYYLLEMQKGNPGGAADHLRVEILDRFGGWYFDTDIQCIEKVDKKIYSGCKLLLYCYDDQNEEIGINNCVMASAPSSLYLQNIKKITAHNYLTEKNTVTGQPDSGFTTRHIMTIKISGPNTLQLPMFLHLFGPSLNIGYLDPRPFASTYDRAWIYPENKFNHLQPEKDDFKMAFMQLINSLVHDLTLDADHLYFDLYEPLFKKFSDYHFCKLSLNFLISFLPDYAQTIKQAIVYESMLNEINYKNNFGNQDIIGYNKKNLPFYGSERLPIIDRVAILSTPVNDTQKNNLFCKKDFWKIINKLVLNNIDPEFANNMATQIALCLSTDLRIQPIQFAQEQLLKALEENDVYKIKSAIRNIGEMFSLKQDSLAIS